MTGSSKRLRVSVTRQRSESESGLRARVCLLASLHALTRVRIPCHTESGVRAPDAYEPL